MYSVYGLPLWTKTQSVKVNECRSVFASAGLDFFKSLRPTKSSAGRGDRRPYCAPAARHTRRKAISLSASASQFLCLVRDESRHMLALSWLSPRRRSRDGHKTTQIGQGARRPMDSLEVLDLLDWTPPRRRR